MNVFRKQRMRCFLTLKSIVTGLVMKWNIGRLSQKSGPQPAGTVMYSALSGERTTILEFANPRCEF
jgi:hypothetical protein